MTVRALAIGRASNAQTVSVESMEETAAEEVAALCSRVLRQNWREGEEDGRHYGFTVPSPGHYPWQWYGGR